MFQLQLLYSFSISIGEDINDKNVIFSFITYQIHDAKDTTWDLWWCETSDLRLALDELRLRPQQRVAHFRNHGELTRKNYLYRNLRRYRRLLLKAGKGREAELCDAMPITFELPSEYRMLVEEYRRRPGTTWIVKPAGGSQVDIINRLFDFQKYLEFRKLILISSLK